jgi:DNA-binding response OmpR family regulator
MLPKKNGIEVLKGIRQSELSTPVMMLTSKSELRDRVNGLDSGADDYLPKPFATEELLARIRALLRRKGTVQADDGLTFGDLCLTPSSLTLSNGLHEIKLTLRECELMELLMIRRGIISSKELIIEKLWGFDSEAEHNNVEVYVSFLRKKLLFMKSKVIITTHRGVGYVLEVTADV